MSGYEFVNLTPEEVEDRRLTLDKAGIRGYLFPIVFLSLVLMIRLPTILTPPKQELGPFKKPNILIKLYRRLKWSLGHTVFPEFGPLHVQVVGLFYASVLLYLVFRDTGNDYMHLTKAFGHIAVSQLPVQYLLSLKHPQNPITLATGLTHERLNEYHRLLGRIIHILLITHGVLYVYFFIAIGVLMKRMNDWDVRYGLMALTTMDLIGVLSLPQIRKRAYHKVFYRSHALLTITLAIIVWLHVPYTRKYVAQAVFFWITNGAMRTGKMGESAAVKCRKVGGKLVQVVATMGGGLLWEDWVPGMHGYINQSGLGPRTPFTVIEAGERNNKAEVHFVVRDLGGPMTGVLGKAAAQDKTLKLEIEGPYGEAREYFPYVIERSNEPTLIVAGGVGATYSLPIYLALSDRRKETSGLKFVWIVQRLEDLRWGLDLLRGKPNRNVEIYITQGKEDEKAASAMALSGIVIHASGSRPKLTATVKEFFGPPGKTYQPATIMVCGPGRLSADLRKALTPYVWDGRKVRWYDEQFGFGGS